MKRALILISALAVIFLMGCGGTKDSSNAVFRTGTQALVMNFMANAPPARLYHNDPLEITVELNNKGAEKILAGDLRLYISGFSEKITPLGSGARTLTQDLLGKEDIPEGGYDAISFKSGIDLPSEYYSPTFLVTACYKYRTLASAQMCIDGNPASKKRKVCTPSSVSLGSGQGGPISVSSVELEPSPGKTRFRIFISNSGGGQVFDEAKLDSCSPYSGSPLTTIDYNVVNVRSVKIHNTALTCNPSTNKIRLVDNKGSFFCEFPVDTATPAYTTPFVVDMSYGYSSQISRKVEIIRMS